MGLTPRGAPVGSSWGVGSTIHVLAPSRGDAFDMITWLVDEVRGIFGVRRAEYGRHSDSFNVVRSASGDPFRASPEMDSESLRAEARRLEAGRRRLEELTSRPGRASH